MRIEQIARSRSPDDPSSVRLSARLVVGSAPASVETVWLDVSDVRPDEVSRAGDPWLVAALPLAATLGESLSVSAPVSPALLAGARRVLETWRRWLGTHVVTVDVPAAPAAPAAFAAHGPGTRVGAFFSGGVDSFYTALDPGDPDDPSDDGLLDDLVFVAGLDVDLGSAAALARVRASLTEAAAGLGKPLLRASTNLRRTRWASAPWTILSHGCALAFVAHALAPRFARVRIASSVYRIARAFPWGSHRDVEPVLSSEALRLVYDRDDVDRFAKVRLLAGHGVARRHLRVCFRSPDGGNCGRCNKCVLTMAMLDACGGQGARTAFPPDPRLVRDAKGWERRFLADLRDHALASGREDLADAAAASIAASARFAAWEPSMDALRRRPLLRPLRRAFEVLVRAGLVPPRKAPRNPFARPEAPPADGR